MFDDGFSVVEDTDATTNERAATSMNSSLFDFGWRTTRTRWFARNIPPFWRRFSLTDSGIVRGNEILAPDAYGDAYATSDGYVFKDVTITRRMIHNNFVSRVFPGEHFVDAIFGNLVNKQDAAANFWVWAVAQESSFKTKALETSATLRVRNARRK